MNSFTTAILYLNEENHKGSEAEIGSRDRKESVTELKRFKPYNIWV